MNNEQWISPDGTFDPSFFDNLPVKVETKMGTVPNGWLTVEEINAKEHKIRIFASYNSSPFQNTVVLKRFYLTQEQLNEYQIKGNSCVLKAPDKKSN